MYEDGDEGKNVDSPRAEINKKGESHDDEGEEEHGAEENDKDQAAAAHTAPDPGHFIFKTKFITTIRWTPMTEQTKYEEADKEEDSQKGNHDGPPHWPQTF